MLQIISLVDITPSGKRSWTWSWTASGSLLTTATCLQAHLLLCVCLSRLVNPNRFGRFRHPRHRTPRLLRLQRMRRRNRIRPWLPHAGEAVGGCAERGVDSHFFYSCKVSAPRQRGMRKILSARKAVRGLWQEEQDLLHRVVLPSGGYCRRRAVQHSPVRAFSPGAHRCDHHAPRMIFATTFIHARFVCRAQTTMPARPSRGTTTRLCMIFAAGSLLHVGLVG